VDRLAELEAGDVAVLARALSIVAVVIPGADRESRTTTVLERLGWATV
jgi:hypothetical protein